MWVVDEGTEGSGPFSLITALTSLPSPRGMLFCKLVMRGRDSEMLNTNAFSFFWNHYPCSMKCICSGMSAVQEGHQSLFLSCGLPCSILLTSEMGQGAWTSCQWQRWDWSNTIKLWTVMVATECLPVPFGIYCWEICIPSCCTACDQPSQISFSCAQNKEVNTLKKTVL